MRHLRGPTASAATAAIRSATAIEPSPITSSATTLRLHLFSDLHLRHKQWREQRLVHGCRREQRPALVQRNAAVWLGLEVWQHGVGQHRPLRRTGQHVEILLRRDVRQHPSSGRHLRAGVRRAPLRGGHAHHRHPVLLPYVRRPDGDSAGSGCAQPGGLGADWPAVDEHDGLEGAGERVHRRRELPLPLHPWGRLPRRRRHRHGERRVRSDRATDAPGSAAPDGTAALPSGL